MSTPDIPDAVPFGMEIEVFADDYDLPLYPWQRMVLLRWFPEPSTKEQP